MKETCVITNRNNLNTKIKFRDERMFLKMRIDIILT